jgi:hypothetical protein
LLTLLLAGAATAQTTGRIEGIVHDPAGVPASGTMLEIVETGTGAARQLWTDERGWYTAPGLAPGSYGITVSHEGCRTELRRGVELIGGRAVRVDFSLQLGERRDSVEVAGAAPLISPAADDWGGAIEQQKLESLPLDGRDLFDLVAQEPGANVATTAASTLATGLGLHVSVNGARSNQNGFLMDGIYINDSTAGAPSSATGSLLGLESIQELQLVASPFDAEYGRGGGAQIIAVSKSGSNQFHGDVYEFLRNSALDTRNFFDPANQKIPPLRKNQFGGLLGGPLKTNKLFFLANYEGIRLASGQTLSAEVPTAQARLGILPTGTVTVSALIAPYLALYPLPNGVDYGDGTGQFLSQGITTSREDYATGKLDAIFSDRLRTSARYTFDEGVNYQPDPLEIFTYINDSRYHFLHTETQFTASPNTLHTFTAGFSRVWDRQTDTDAAPASLSFVPGQPLGYLSMSSGLTSIGGSTGDSVELRPRDFVTNDYQLNYTLTHIRGAHTLRLGASFDRIQFNQESDRGVVGSYVFSSLASLLAAKPNSGEILLPGSDSIRGWRQDLASAFIQDGFHASSRLSFALGVRYEPYSVPTEVNGKIATIPNFLTATTTTVGGPLFVNPSRTNFAPRASLAWQPFSSGKTVIRAGGGIFYDAISTQELVVAGVRLPPFYELGTVTKPSFPNLVQAAAGATPSATLDMLAYHLQQPYVAQYQLVVQQAVARDTVFQVGYVGSRGIHLPGQVTQSNPVVPQVLADGSLFFPANGARLNPAFGNTRTRSTRFDSSYSGLQAELDRQWRAGFRLQLKYVWSKSLDDTSSIVNADYLNSSGVPTMFDFSLNRGRSDFDMRQVFGGNFSWQIPHPSGVVAAAVLGGWELHGVVQAQTGPPFSPTVGFDRANLSAGTSTDPGERPVWIGATAPQAVLGSPQRWFNPADFALPSTGTYGNLGRNVFDGPGLVNVDLALHRVLWKTDRQSVRLRVETFNDANHPNFQIPSALSLFTSSLTRVGSAGQITATTTASRQIQMALKWAF